MLVENLTPEGLVPVEVADDVLRAASHVEELLLLRDLKSMIEDKLISTIVAIGAQYYVEWALSPPGIPRDLWRAIPSSYPAASLGRPSGTTKAISTAVVLLR